MSKFSIQTGNISSSVMNRNYLLLNWESVTFGNGTYVAVASSGIGSRVMSSTDGINWTPRLSASDNDWKSVTYGSGLFVAVASSGTGNRVMTSPDGITWTSRTSAANNNWTSVTYGNELFVAVANSGTQRVMTSTDGITWTLRNSANDANGWNSVTYGLDMCGNGIYVAVASSGTNKVMVSSNGTSWTSHSASTEGNTWTAVTSGLDGSGNSLFVAVSSSAVDTNCVMSSSDGVTWTGHTATSGQYKAVTYGNGKFVAFGNNSGLIQSTNGTIWSYTSVTGLNSGKVFYLNDKLVYTCYGAVGYSLTVNPTWSYSSITNINSSIAYGNGIYVAVASSTYNAGVSVFTAPHHVMTSVDGINWSMSLGATNIQSLNKVIFGDNIFVTVGFNGTIATSADGDTWINCTVPYLDYKSVAYGNGIYVAVANGTKIVVSSDAVNWSSVTVSSSSWDNVAFGNGMFVATSSSYSGVMVMYSSDGNTWTPATITGLPQVTQMSFVNGRFIGTADKTMITSTNGTTWSLTAPNIGPINSIAYNGSLYIGTRPNNQIYLSPNLVSWSTTTVPAPYSGAKSVIYMGDNKFLIANDFFNVSDYTNINYAHAPLALTLNVPKIGVFNDFEKRKDMDSNTFTITPPSSTGNGAWSFTSSNTAVATISGSTVTIKALGKTTISARQAETATYLAGGTSCVLTIRNPTPLEIYKYSSWTVATKISKLFSYGYDAIEGLIVGFTAAQLYPTYSLSQLRTAGVDIVTLSKLSGVTLTMLRLAGFTAAQVYTYISGTTYTKLYQAGYSLADIKAVANPTITQMLGLSATITTLMLKNAGYTSTEMGTAWSTNKITTAQFLAAGYSIVQYYNAGVLYNTMLAYGYSSSKLKKPTGPYP